jgi:hypothetical protein
MAPGLSSPVTKEFTVSGGRELGGKGSAEVTHVMWHTDNFIEDFIDIANVKGGEPPRALRQGTS